MYKGTPWPGDDELLDLFAQMGFSRKAVAEHLGRHPETLRSYLRKHRPELNARLAAVKPPGKSSAQRSREHRGRHPERRRAERKAHYLANRDRILEKNAEWHRANRDRVRARKAREREENRDRINRVRRERQDRNRAAVRRYVQLQYHRRKGGGPEAVEYAAILLGDPCSYCGAPTTDIDHVVPLARGGSPAWDNLTAACARCNCSKQARSLLVFMLDRMT